MSNRLTWAIRLDGTGMFFAAFIVPLSANTLGLDAGQIGVLVALGALGIAVSQGLAYSGLRRGVALSALRVGGWIKAAAYLLLWGAIEYREAAVLALACFATGFGSGLFGLMWQTRLATAPGFEGRASALGYGQRQAGFGVMIGSCVGFTWLGFSGEYSVLLAYALCSAVSALMMAERVIRPEVPEATGFMRARGKAVIVILVVIVTGQLGASVMAPFLQLYLIDSLEVLDPSTLAMVYVPGGLTAMLVAPKLGRWIDKTGQVKVLILASLWGALTTWLLVNAESLYQITLLFVLDSVMITAGALSVAKLASETLGSSAGEGLSLQGMAGQLGTIVSPLVGGLCWQLLGSFGPFGFAIGCELSIALLAALFLTGVQNRVYE